jgi:hypothetical protein
MRTSNPTTQILVKFAFYVSELLTVANKQCSFFYFKPFNHIVKWIQGLLLNIHYVFLVTRIQKTRLVKLLLSLVLDSRSSYSIKFISTYPC